MKQTPVLTGHGILEAAEVRQTIANEVIQHDQRFVAIQRPGHGLGLRVAEAVHAGLADHDPERAMIVAGQAQLRQRRITTPGLAVVVIVVPLAAFGAAIQRHQHTGALTHLAVERLHQPLPAIGKMPGDNIARGQEMLAVMCRDRQVVTGCPA